MPVFAPPPAAIMPGSAVDDEDTVFNSGKHSIRSTSYTTISSQSWAPERFEVCKLEGLPDPIVCSESIKKALEKIARMGGSGAPVLITGETGTGKELFARAVHLSSTLRHQPFIPFNCATISRELAESHLFGHRRGSFTGALTDNQGVIRDAEGGTLFLDEIGEMSPDLQPKLLRFVQEGEIHPVGETRPLKVGVRIVVATNRDLAIEIVAGRFRADLFYRLNVLNIHLPPLRSERERIKPLIAYYFDYHCRQAGRHELQLSAEAVELLCRYDWPGNVRELSAEIQRLVWEAQEKEVVTADHLSPQVRDGKSHRHEHSIPQLHGKIPIDENQSYASAKDQLAREMFTRALNRCGGNVSKAAEELGMDRVGLSKAIKRLGIRQ